MFCKLYVVLNNKMSFDTKISGMLSKVMHNLLKKELGDNNYTINHYKQHCFTINYSNIRTLVITR